MEQNNEKFPFPSRMTSQEPRISPTREVFKIPMTSEREPMRMAAEPKEDDSLWRGRASIRQDVARRGLLRRWNREHEKTDLIIDRFLMGGIVLGLAGVGGMVLKVLITGTAIVTSPIALPWMVMLASGVVGGGILYAVIRKQIRKHTLTTMKEKLDSRIEEREAAKQRVR